MLAKLGDGTPFVPGMTVYTIDGLAVPTECSHIESSPNDLSWMLYIWQRGGQTRQGAIQSFYSSPEAAKAAKAQQIQSGIEAMEKEVRAAREKLAALVV